MDINEWKSQIKRGTLEYCILLMIRNKPLYGYEIISRLEKWPIVSVNENTIYPLLRRLSKDGNLSSYWEEAGEGVPPRKYYSITDQGKEYLDAMNAEWNNLLGAIEDLSREE